MNIKTFLSEYESLDEKTIKNIETGIFKYRNIQKMFREKKFIEKDYDCEPFQKAFRGFYRVRGTQDFMDMCVTILKKNDTDIYSVLNKLSSVSKRAELAVASKLIHTINDNSPIYDKFVAINLELKTKNEIGLDKKIADRIIIYKELDMIIKKWLLEPSIQSTLIDFSKRVDCKDISDTKKLDFILWQLRPKE